MVTKYNEAMMESVTQQTLGTELIVPRATEI